MSSSTFEVIETENESEKEISFGLEACEENGIESQEEGEVQKDHTYTKDPDDSSVSFNFCTIIYFNNRNTTYLN